MDGHTAQTSLAAAPSRSEVAPSVGKAGWAAAGGILGALAASSCCILPLALFMLGISGAWIGNLTARPISRSSSPRPPGASASAITSSIASRKQRAPTEAARGRCRGGASRRCCGRRRYWYWRP